ncbi:calcium-binding EF-hand [Pandoraea horticolens]|uniref:Calcium-binding EF-hand n=1 Tax=Pandoraea horticolens TaxID=2508298 RepID=A0A5E4XSX4_9BURK|nr:hypothetical protein [Pandoraea horticolens]VVE39454.1 calcium-binding EF-hand [Pandoraea horticolens]
MTHQDTLRERTLRTLTTRRLGRRALAAADKDGDGYLSRDEVATAEPFLYQHFDEIDVNHDGKLSPAEIRAYFRRYHQERTQADAAATKP